MKILCPTDLSKPALNAMEYASKLAQSLNATLTLVNIQKIHIGEGVSLISGGERESLLKAKSISDVLDDYCRDISLTFKISCNHLVIPTMESIENAIAEEGSNFDLIVVGTNGSNDLYQFYFGSNSYHIAKNVLTPVLIIPENCSFKSYREICVATDYTTDEEIRLQQLDTLFKPFNLHFDIIHLSEKDTELSRAIYRAFCSLVEEKTDLFSRATFKRLISNDTIGELKNIVDSSKTDLLVLSFQKHNMFYKLFHKNLIKEICSYSSIPLLTIH